MRLRRKFALAGFLLVLAVLLATGTLQYAVEKRELEAGMTDAQRAALSALAKSCEEALSDDNDLAILDYFRTFLTAEGLSYITVTDRSGTVLMDTRLLKGDRSWYGKTLADPLTKRTLSAQAPTSIPTTEDGKRLLVWYAPLRPRGKPTAVLRMAYERNAIEEYVRDALLESLARFGMVASFCFALAAVGALILAGLFDRRIQALDDGARRYAQGQFSHVIALGGDDELAALGDTLNAMARRIAELDEFKRQLFHGISHDLKAPLGAMQGFTELLLSGRAGPVSEVQRQYLDAVQLGARTLRAFIDNILDLARLESPKFVLNLKSFEPERLAKAALSLFAAQAQALGVGLSSEVPAGLPRVLADEGQIGRVLANLLSNALNFTPDGGSVVLTASLVRFGNDAVHVAFSVLDSGCGIAADQLPLVFSKFHRVAANQAYARFSPGTGLGLAIVKAVVEAHGGSVWAQSKPGNGSKFTFTLPQDDSRVCEAGGRGP